MIILGYLKPGFWKRKQKRLAVLHTVLATSKLVDGIATSKFSTFWQKRKRESGSGRGGSKIDHFLNTVFKKQ